MLTFLLFVIPVKISNKCLLIGHPVYVKGSCGEVHALYKLQMLLLLKCRECAKEANVILKSLLVWQEIYQMLLLT